MSNGNGKNGGTAEQTGLSRIVQYVVPEEPAVVEAPPDNPRGEGMNKIVATLLVALAITALAIIALTIIRPAPPPETARVSVSTLVLREGPGLQFKPRYILPLNWGVSMLREEHKSPDGEWWVKVSVDTQEGPQEGWVSRKYLYKWQGKGGAVPMSGASGG
jgi:hypothetical protein